MCCRGLGAAAASILSQSLELQGFFLYGFIREAARKKKTESEKDKESYTEREREREREREIERER
jgi:hypothetical protein